MSCQDDNMFSQIKEYLRPRRDAFVKSFRSNTNPLLGKYRRKTLSDTNFSIISNNCWAGIVYQYYDLPYQSPTIGLYFFADDYVRFVSDLRHYCGCELSFIQAKNSRYHEVLKERGQDNIPIGLLDDVEIMFLHYSSPEEAMEKWDRRVRRINWDHLIIKFSQQNLATIDHLIAVDRLPYKDKIIFTTGDYGLSSQVIYKESLGLPEIFDEVTHFKSYLDLPALINGRA